VISAILRNRIAVVGVPAALFESALITGVASALEGFSERAPIGLGLLTLLVGIVFYRLMTMCVVCIA
jgi:hypothetical protein